MIDALRIQNGLKWEKGVYFDHGLTKVFWCSSWSSSIFQSINQRLNDIYFYDISRNFERSSGQIDYLSINGS